MALARILRSPAAVAAAGMLVLAVAMGIGRFAFTPLLPLMNQEGRLSIAGGGWLAAANYAGYLAGALLAARLRVRPQVLAVGGLALIAASTAAMALPGMALWMALRFLAGVCSAGVFVAASVWCLGALARGGRTDLAGWMFSGVGAGIAVSGLYVLAAGTEGMTSGMLWLRLGAWAALLAALACGVLSASEPPDAPRPAAAGSRRLRAPPGTAGMILSYGIMGFGYILPATFLPVLARSVVQDPRIFGLAWPVFGATSFVAMLVSQGWIGRWGRLRVWAWSQGALAVGVAMPGLWLAPATILVSALLVGSATMVITLAGIQEIRERVAENPGAWVGYMTAAFAVGQIAGPLFSSLMMAGLPHPESALAICFLVAAGALAASTVWLLRLAAAQRPGT